MKSIVTGAAGFIGSTLSERLLEQGHQVIGVDCFLDYYPRELKEKNLEKVRDNSNYQFIEGDLLDLDLAEILAGTDYIYHQAAQAGVRSSWGSDFSIYTNTNILATQKLLEACRDKRVSESLKKLVYASSSSVYGDAESLPTVETMRPKPLSPYGVSKLAAEHLCLLYDKEFNVPTVSLRYFTVFGPRQRPDMAFRRFITAALKEEEIRVFDDGEQSRDFTFIDDIIKANIDSAQAKTRASVFNIGGGSRVTVNQVLEMISEIVSKKLNVTYLPREYGDVKHTAADTSQAQEAFSYNPEVSLREGLTKQTAWIEQIL